MYTSCVTKSVLLLPECVPSVNVAQIIVIVRRLYRYNLLYLMGVFSNFGKRGIIFKYLVMVVMRGPNSQTHNPPKMLAECTLPPLASCMTRPEH